MAALLRLTLLPASLLAGACLLGAPVPGPAGPEGKETAAEAVYHADRGHLWNRVHTALFVRTGPDGRRYGQDRLEPLLWAGSEHLSAGPSADRAVAVLDEFLRDNGEELVADPVKRAVLQRDLWLVADLLAGRPGDDRPRVEVPLAKVIRRLALTPDQVAGLPDNYAAAVTSKQFADTFDPARPDRAYLPPDLFKPDGPWVCVGRADGRTAPFHLAEGIQFTNSAFLVFLKLPGGRAVTLDFLKRLAAFDQPLLLPNADAKTNRHYPALPNPALPQWPKGTEVALVRRAMLIDSTRRVVAAPLTESVQLRVTRTNAPALTPETLGKASSRREMSWQAFAEFQLRRMPLFAGAAGGLRDVSAEADFSTGFNARAFDVFEEPVRADRPFPRSHRPFETNRASCAACHNFPGVYSFNSVQGFSFGGMQSLRIEDGEEPKPHTLLATPVGQVERSAVEWKEKQPGWAALRKRLPE